MQSRECKVQNQLPLTPALSRGERGNRSQIKMKSASVLTHGNRAAFTLIEVMIAMAILFIALFSILELTSRSLRQANSLRKTSVDASSLAAELSLTNKLMEGVESGDFGDLYPGYSWSRETYLFASNGLYQVDFTVQWDIARPPVQTKMSVLLYRPDSVVTPSQAVRPGGMR